MFSLDLLNFCVEQNRNIVLNKVFHQHILGLQVVAPVNQCYVNTDIMHMEGFSDSAIASADDYCLTAFENWTVAGTAITYAMS